MNSDDSDISETSNSWKCSWRQKMSGAEATVGLNITPSALAAPSSTGSDRGLRVIASVNSSRYGNASVIFTESGGAAREYRYQVEAGMVGVNVGVAAPVAWFPFSGWKDSIDGDLHSNGRDAVEFYTRKKVVTARWA